MYLPTVKTGKDILTWIILMKNTGSGLGNSLICAINMTSSYNSKYGILGIIMKITSHLGVGPIILSIRQITSHTLLKTPYCQLKWIIPHRKTYRSPFFPHGSRIGHNVAVLKYQNAFVDKLLSISFAYPNIIYCINNESGEHIEWSDYWADYLHARA